MPSGGSVLILLAQLFCLGYLCTYMFAVIAHAAGGDNDLPSFPRYTSLYEDIVRPFIMVCASFIFASPGSSSKNIDCFIAPHFWDHTLIRSLAKLHFYL